MLSGIRTSLQSSILCSVLFVTIALLSDLAHAVTSPLDLFTPPDDWESFNSNTLRDFQLMGNTYRFTTALTFSDDVGPIILPVVAKVIDGSGNVAIITDEDERLAVMLYAKMRYDDFNLHGRINSQDSWDAWAQTMRLAADNSDPEQAKIGIHLMNAGTVLFGVGLSGLTAGASAPSTIATIGNILTLTGHFANTMSTTFSAPDSDSNEYRAAFMANNLVSPETFDDNTTTSSIFTKNNVENYIIRGADALESLTGISSDGLEVLGLLTKNNSDHLMNNLGNAIDLVLDPNNGLNLSDKIELYNLKYHKVLFNKPHQFLRAFGLSLGTTAIQMSVEKLTEVGPICEELLAHANYHYNAMALVAESIADDIRDINTISSPFELQKHLTFLGIKVHLYYKCFHELSWAMHLRLQQVNEHWYYNWMIADNDLLKLANERDDLEGISNTFSRLLAKMDESLFYMNTFYKNILTSQFLQVAGTGDSTVDLRWSEGESSNNISHYRINYGTSSGNLNNLVETSGNQVIYNFANLQNGTRYFFQVYPVFLDGGSGQTSNEVSAVPLDPSQTISNVAPSIVITKPSLKGEIADWDGKVINWIDDDPDDNADIALYYDVDTSTGNGKSGVIHAVREDDVDGYYWDVSQVQEGEYYILGEISDGKHTTHDYSSGTVIVQHPNVGNHFQISAPGSWQWEDDNSNNQAEFVNGIAEGLEHLEVHIAIENTSSKNFQYVHGYLSSKTSAINFSDGDTFVQYGPALTMATIHPEDDFGFRVTTPYFLNTPFELVLKYKDSSGTDYIQTLPFTYSFPAQGTSAPILSISDIIIDDSNIGGDGDGDGIIESGEKIGFFLPVTNSGSATCINPKGVLVQQSDWGSDVFSDFETTFPDIGMGQTQNHNSDLDTNRIPKYFSGTINGNMTVLYGPDRDKSQTLPFSFTVQPTAHLRVSPETYDFAAFPPGASNPVPISIVNDGSAPLDITTIQPSHTDTTIVNAPVLPLFIDPGQSLNLTVNIDSSSLSGQISRTIIVSSSSAYNPQPQSLIITGIVGEGGGEVALVEGDGHQYYPHIYENKLVYSDYSSGLSQIYLKNLDTGVTSQLSSGDFQCYSPRIYENYVVWNQRPSNGSTPEKELALYDLHTPGNPPLIITNDSYGDSDARIWGDYIIWSKMVIVEPSIKRDIYLYNIANQTTTQLTNTPSTDEDDPEFHGNYAAWYDESSRISIYNLTTGQISQVADFYSLDDLGIFNNNMVWVVEKTSSDDYIDVFLYSNGSTTNLSRNYDALDEVEATIWGGKVVYYEETNKQLYIAGTDGSGPDVFIDNTASKEDLFMYDDKVVWADYRNGNWDIFMKSTIPDNLYTSDINIQFDKTEIVEGESLTISSIINNTGANQLKNVTVRFYSGHPSRGGLQIGIETIISSLSAGCSQPVSATWNQVSSAFSQICVSVDPDNAAAENNELDNIACRPYSIVDNDTQGPNIFDIAISEFQGDGDGLVEDNEQLILSWKASDPSGLGDATGSINTTPYSINVDTTDPQFTLYTITAGPLSAGTVSYEITSEDADDTPETSTSSGTISILKHAPTVTSTYPADGALGIPLRPELSVIFDTPLDGSTVIEGALTLANGSGTPLEGELTYNAQLNQITFLPKSELSYSSTYAVDISTEYLTDENGNPLKEAFSWTFTTLHDDTAPQATITSPAADATFTGIVVITGTAWDANFHSYQLFYSSISTPDAFIDIAPEQSASVISSELGSWDTSQLPDGKYNITLVVTDSAVIPNISQSQVSINKATLSTYFLDSDGDGYGDPANTTEQITLPQGYVENGTDCDDSKSTINPDATEICDNVDNNCNRQIDEGVQTAWFADTDGDNFGNAASTIFDCNQPPGYVLDNTDCNDSDIKEHPGQVWYKDDDEDGDGDIFQAVVSCLRPIGYVLPTNEQDYLRDCVSILQVCTGETTQHTLQSSLPDIGDDNKYGLPESLQILYRLSVIDIDSDNDGYLIKEGDCNDTNSEINPSALEICGDGIDQNCDGVDPACDISAELPEGLIAHYSFEGNADDSVGAHAGTPIGGITYTEGVTGQAAHFNGIDAYIAIPYAEGFNFNPTQSFSIAMWTQKITPATVYEALLTKGGWDYGLYVSPGNNFMGGLHANHEVFSASSATSEWQHVTLTYDNGSWRIYINGQLETSKPNGALITQSGLPLAIGRKGNTALDFFHGNIDELLIYNRALSPTEIWQIATPEELSCTGEFHDFTSNVAPAGWVETKVNSGNISGGKVWGVPTDGYVKLTKDVSALSPEYDFLTLEWDGSVNYAFWGQQTGAILIMRDNQKIAVTNGMSYENFGGDDNVLTLSGTSTNRYRYPVEYADFHLEVTYTNNNVNIVLTRIDDSSQVFNITENLPIDGFRLEDIAAVEFVSSATTDNSIWMDNISFNSCRRIATGN